MLLPKRVKYRKVHRGRMKGKATRGNFVAYGEYGIIATEPCWITSNQIEAARIAINRSIRRGGKVWIKIFPHKPVTKKPAETRMGSGKGSPDHWVAVVKPGRVLFEIAGVSEEAAREALRLGANKLPCKTKFIYRDAERVGEFQGLSKKTLLRAQLAQEAEAVAFDADAIDGETDEAVETDEMTEQDVETGGVSDDS